MAEIAVHHPQKPWYVRMHLDPQWNVATLSSQNKSVYQSGLHHSTRSIATLKYMVPWDEFQHCVVFILALRASFSASLCEHFDGQNCNYPFATMQLLGFPAVQVPSWAPMSSIEVQPHFFILSPHFLACMPGKQVRD